MAKELRTSKHACNPTIDGALLSGPYPTTIVKVPMWYERRYSQLPGLGSGRSKREGGGYKWKMGWGHGCYSTFINIIGIRGWCGTVCKARQVKPGEKGKREHNFLRMRILIKISGQT